MSKRQSLRKAKRTFSLSRQTVAFLESERKAKAQKSLSAVLEEIVRGQQEKNESERISAAITQYYDSISEEQRQEDSAWGAFAESQFPDQE